MKTDLKKDLKEFYSAKTGVTVFVKVPPQKVISISGVGDPNISPEFNNDIMTLYPIAYYLKFACKKMDKDFAVMPMEGLWWMDNMNEFTVENKKNWKWTIFVVQPDFVTQQLFEDAVEYVRSKKKAQSIDKVKFETLNEGLSAQTLYTGAYKDEGPAILQLHKFITENGHKFDGLVQKHHEIYLSDMRHTAPEKLKTIIRQPVA